MPGGFHPFHAGHMALYNSARKAFPDADLYVAATNSQEERPFPFAVKEKLAKVAGVEPGHFIQVKSPFQAKEITQHYNPEQDVLIFVRSEKDRNESPKPGGTKKDGSPAYFQPWTGKNVQPFGQHAYFAYLPTVKFGPGITSATEIRKAWPTLNDKRKTAMVMSLYPASQKNPKLAANIVAMLDQVMGGQVSEGLSDAVKGIKRKVAGKQDPKEVEHMYGRMARSAIKHKTPDQAEKDIQRYNRVAKVVNKEDVAEGDDRGDYHSIARAANQASRTAKSSQDHAKAADLHSRAATYGLSAGQDQSVIHDHQMAAWEHNRASKKMKEDVAEAKTPKKEVMGFSEYQFKTWKQYAQEEGYEIREAGNLPGSYAAFDDDGKRVGYFYNKFDLPNGYRHVGELIITSVEDVAEGLNDKPEAGDKIVWYHSNHYPKLEGEVVGWKDGHLIVKSIDPSPANTEKTVATYRVPKNNILSVEKQGVAEGFGLPMPGTYEQEHDMDQKQSGHRTHDLTSESSLSESQDYLDEK